eukprot:358353-Chlamydomonas_euryale.AAC.3
MPGDNFRAKVELALPVAMQEGLRFAIRDSGRTVGAGVVTKKGAAVSFRKLLRYAVERCCGELRKGAAVSCRKATAAAKPPKVDTARWRAAVTGRSGMAIAGQGGAAGIRLA